MCLNCNPVDDVLPAARRWYGVPHKNYLKNHARCELREYIRPDNNAIEAVDADQAESGEIHEDNAMEVDENQGEVNVNPEAEGDLGLNPTYLNRDQDAGRNILRNGMCAAVGLPIHEAFQRRQRRN